MIVKDKAPLITFWLLLLFGAVIGVIIAEVMK